MSAPVGGPLADVVELIGNPYPRSRARELAAAVRHELVANAAVTVGQHLLIELGGDCREWDRAVPPAGPVLLLVATPVYHGSYTGLLKLALDQLPRRALAGTVAVPLLTANSSPHLPAAATSLTHLLAALGAVVPVPAVAVPGLRPVQVAAAVWAEQHAPAVAAALAGDPGHAGHPAVAVRDRQLQSDQAAAGMPWTYRRAPPRCAEARELHILIGPGPAEGDTAPVG